MIGGAGAGSRPFYAPGKAYLAGPYKGAPLSLVVVVPAVSGPYDLGNIVVRNALYVDPESAQVSAVSDPLPQIVEGVPLRVSSVLVNLNRPNFAINPTNCDPHPVNAKIYRRRRSHGNALSPLPGGQLRQPALRAEALAEADRRHQARRAPSLRREP